MVGAAAALSFLSGWVSISIYLASHQILSIISIFSCCLFCSLFSKTARELQHSCTQTHTFFLPSRLLLHNRELAANVRIVVPFALAPVIVAKPFTMVYRYLDMERMDASGMHFTHTLPLLLLTGILSTI